MAPAQSLAIDDDGGESKIVVKSEEKNQNGFGLVCESNFQDSGFYGDSTSKVDALDQEVDVVGFEDCEGAEVEGGEDPDATEHSSSFGNTFSGSEDEARMSSSDLEVDSQFSIENGEEPSPEGIGRLLKKKKVTDQWQSFIRPLTWRCQWLELRMNELHSQALLYDKELAAYKREKQLQSKMIELDDSVSRSVPLACHSHRKRVLKRKKRTRIEDTDTLSYMKKHRVFSYYENNRAETDCQAVKNNCDNQEDDDKSNDDYETILQSLNRGDSSLEKILQQLDNIQTKVFSLRSQLSDVMKRNPIEVVSSSPANFLWGDPPASHARSSSFSPDNNGDIVHHHGYEHEFEVPGSTVSSYGDITEANDDYVLINHQAPEEERDNGVYLKTVKEEAQSCSEDTETAPRAPAVAAAGGSRGQRGRPPLLKPCYTGKKRGRKPKRKLRSGLRSERIKRQFN